MIIKQYLPFRYSREGCIPDRLHLQFFDGDAQQCQTELSRRKKTAHYHLACDGTVTALSPLSAAANLLGPVGEVLSAPEPIPEARRGILILIEGREKTLSEEQTEPLIRLLKGIQKEVFRIYGETFPFCRKAVVCNEDFPVEDLLERGYLQPQERTLFRVQTGSYRTRRDAEDSVERLQRAGIAAYITEVRCG